MGKAIACYIFIAKLEELTDFVL